MVQSRSAANCTQVWCLRREPCDLSMLDWRYTAVTAWSLSVAAGVGARKHFPPDVRDWQMITYEVNASMLSEQGKVMPNDGDANCDRQFLHLLDSKALHWMEDTYQLGTPISMPILRKESVPNNETTATAFAGDVT
jgi:hypothetical protein